jgi:hypothetical protein
MLQALHRGDIASRGVSLLQLKRLAKQVLEYCQVRHIKIPFELQACRIGRAVFKAPFALVPTGRPPLCSPGTET